MKQDNSLSSKLIHSRFAIIGTHNFEQLGLTSIEINIFLTVRNRADWSERMQNLLPDFECCDIDEEEL
ncbi:MAG: hypothetical protein P1P78_15755 [Methyloprofundus sp.]|nr:hypothetical protein [Methyloprofundus sp.]